MDKEFKQKYELMAKVAELYNKNISESTISFMLESFTDIPFKYLEKSVLSWIKESPFIFSISDIRQLVKDMFPEVFQREELEPFTKTEWLEHCIKRDMEELGLDEEDYQEYVEHQEKQHSEPYIAPGVDNVVFEE